MTIFVTAWPKSEQRTGRLLLPVARQAPPFSSRRSKPEPSAAPTGVATAPHVFHLSLLFCWKDSPEARMNAGYALTGLQGSQKAHAARSTMIYIL